MERFTFGLSKEEKETLEQMRKEREDRQKEFDKHVEQFKKSIGYEAKKGGKPGIDFSNFGL